MKLWADKDEDLWVQTSPGRLVLVHNEPQARRMADNGYWGTLWKTVNEMFGPMTLLVSGPFDLRGESNE